MKLICRKNLKGSKIFLDVQFFVMQEKTGMNQNRENFENKVDLF